jgi:plasmid stabilization system protein ParE
MKYQVEITHAAWDELSDNYEWLRLRAPLAAKRWRVELLRAVDSLESQPDRCPLADEADEYGLDIRQLALGRGRRVYRILFQIRGNTVYVLRIRHAAQRPLRPEELGGT